MQADKKKLGDKIRFYREKANKELSEVSDAIELDPKTLTQIEAGETEADEEILALLMSHFNLGESAAFELWELAGYDMGELVDMSIIGKSQEDTNHKESEEKKELRISMPADLKVLYSDMVQVSANKFGVTIQFIQTVPGGTGQVVSRIGMSKEHAQSLVDILGKNVNNPN